ncbi:MAG: S1C family serine protease [Phycisphaerales bacterium JB063]
MRIIPLPLLLVLALFVGCASTPPPNIVDDGTLYATLRDASASVLKDGRIAGSGSFIDREGTFLTAAHVVHGMEHRLELLLNGSRVIPAEVVAKDLGADIAILRPVQPTDSASSTTPAFAPIAWLTLSDTPPAAGAPVYVYGAPAMYRDLMLPGRIASDHPRYNHQGANDCYLHSVNLAGPTPPGISGGCWVDANGRVIGVQCSHIGSEKATTGMGFIAPLVDIQRLVAQRTDHPVTTFGAQVVTLWSQSYGYTRQFELGSAGVAVHRLIDGGPAQRAGVPTDVLITHVDGQATPDIAAFMDVIRSHRPGDSVEVRTVAPNSHNVETFRVELDELKW